MFRETQYIFWTLSMLQIAGKWCPFFLYATVVGITPCILLYYFPHDTNYCICLIARFFFSISSERGMGRANRISMKWMATLLKDHEHILRCWHREEGGVEGQK